MDPQQVVPGTLENLPTQMAVTERMRNAFLPVYEEYHDAVEQEFAKHD